MKKLLTNLYSKIFKIRFTIGKITSLIFAFIGCFIFGIVTGGIIAYGFVSALVIGALCSVLIMIFTIMLYFDFKTYEEALQ